MKRSVLLLVALSLVVPAAAQGTGATDEALEILRKVDSAVKQVDSVRYESKRTATGIAAQRSGPIEGEAYLEGWYGGVPQRFYAHVKTRNPQTGEEIELTGGGDGDSYFIVDHGTKKGYEDMDPAVMGRSGRALLAIGMMELVHDRPYDDELGAELAELLEDEEVAGEPCYQIHVVYRGGGGESIWFFSKNDYLPRRRIRVMNSAQGEGSIDHVVMNLEIEPQVEAALFKMKLPEGYEAIDDFAP